MEDPPASARAWWGPALAAALGAVAVIDAFTLHEYELAAWPMMAVAVLAALVVRKRQHEGPGWAHGVTLLAAAILFFDGFTYLQPNECGPFAALGMPISWVTQLYLNVMSATRVVPLFAAFLAGAAMSVWQPTRWAGLWALGCALIVILVNSQLHYTGDPGHCPIH